MADIFSQSKTKENLMRAFAGESQARNRYTIAAEKAREQGMYAIADIFLYTAEQERAHAERFYELLQPLSGEIISIDGSYPVDLQESVEELLMAAEHNEKEEYEDVYPAFGKTAQQEGFHEAAAVFFQIAQIEHVHQMRFGEIAQMLKSNTWYESPEESRWICTNCGYIHEGKQAPQICPVCRYKQGYFLPDTFVPYRGETV